MTTCGARYYNAVNTLDGDRILNHDGDHAATRDGEIIAAWPQGSTMGASASAQADPERDSRRDTLASILDRLDRGKTLTNAERHALRTVTAAEQADCDRIRAAADQYLARADRNGLDAEHAEAVIRAREIVARAEAAEQQRDEAREAELDARNIHEGARLALSDALGLGTGAPWDVLAGRARELADARETAGTARSASDVLVQHDVTRKAMCNALGAGWHLNWQQIIDTAQRSRNANAEWQREVESLRQRLDRAHRADEEAGRAAAAAVAAARQAEQQAGETLVTRHRQLADALGQPITTSWPDLITAAFRAYRAADLLTGADRERQAAEQRARDTTRTLRETEQQLAATRRDAAAARIRAGHAWADRNRYRTAWHNARRRARALSAELTRRAYDGTMYASRAETAEATLAATRKQVAQLTARLGQYADRSIANGQRADAAEATLAHVRTAVTAARACMTAMDVAGPAQCLQCGADHLAATETALGQPADPCDCGQTDCTTCNPIQCATAAAEPEPPAEPSRCTCAGVGFGTGTCAVHYPPETTPHAEPDGAALWATIRDHAAADHQFWDRLMLVRGRR